MFELALEMLERGKVDPSIVFTHALPFDRFAEAYDMACYYKDGVVKSLITFPEESEQAH